MPSPTTTNRRIPALLTLTFALLTVGCAHKPAATSGTTYSYTPRYVEPRPVDPTVACDAIQRDRGIPVACTTRFIEGVPSMIIGFQGSRSGEAWISPVLNAVAVPFCANTASAQQTALVFFTFLSDQVARGYNCRTGDWSPWFSTASGDWRLSSY